MSGQEYNKEAILGGSIAKAIGKGITKYNPIKGFKDMISSRLNGKRLGGKQITQNHLLAPRKIGQGTPFKINGSPRKSTLNQTLKGKVRWGATPQQAASRGAQGNPATMSANQFSNKPPVTSRQTPLKPPKPSEPVSTVSPGGQTDTKQLQARISKLEKKNSKLKKDGKSQGMLSDMNKSYRKSTLYKDFGYKPVIAGGALAAYSAGNSGSGAPVIVNN